MRNKIREKIEKIKAQQNVLSTELGAEEGHVLGVVGPSPWWYELTSDWKKFMSFWEDVVKNIAGKPSNEMFVTADVFEAMVYGDVCLAPNQVDTPVRPNVSFNWDSIPLYTIITCLPFGDKAIMTPRGIAPISDMYFM